MPRLFLIFAIIGAGFASNWDDSANALAQKVLAHLMPDEVAAVTWREGAPAEVKSAFARALQRRVRNPRPVEVRAFLSENVRGPLLIAEIVRDGGNVVEMAGASGGGSIRAQLPLKLTLVWEQQNKILDVAFLNDQMLVLDLAGITAYRRQEGQWHSVETISIASTPVRDPRGRIDVAKNPVVLYLPGRICSKQEGSVLCEPGGIFTAGRNTMSDDGWPMHYMDAEIAGERILAETDGRIHLYDANKTPLGIFDGWGSDFAVISSCDGPKILASTASADSVGLYGLVNRQPIQMSDTAALPGPISAIWPQGSGAMTIAKNSKTGRYEAYSASLDCGN